MYTMTTMDLVSKKKTMFKDLEKSLGYFGQANHFNT